MLLDATHVLFDATHVLFCATHVLLAPTSQRHTVFKLWQSVWLHCPLMDIHGFPLWEREAHDLLQKHFPAIQRIFSHYTKGISGMDSAADALEMELEEFHDFVKETHLETRTVNFTIMSNAFAK